MNIAAMETALSQGHGILRLLPAWVPRSFCRPGKRIKLHPDDYYALGLKRGAIDERWLASTTKADNGPDTPPDEGLSYVAAAGGRVLLRDMVEHFKGALIGADLWKKYSKWPMYSKFFDNLGPLPHHIHHSDYHAAKVGQSGKPEMYFFPSQMNNHGGEFPFTFFGLNPGTTREQLLEALKAFPKGDNRLLALSRAYLLEPDTGWDVPPGVLHAPGSLCTYEPQFASDVYAMYQSVLYYEHCVPEELLWKDCPPEERGNHEYLAEVVDWPLNTDPNFQANRFMAPISLQTEAEETELGYREEWICYKCKLAGAKRLTIRPGRTVTIHDPCAYGLICLQGHGTIGGQCLESPTLIRYGEETWDEYFVAADAAQKGVEIYNRSGSDMVMLKHFGENPVMTSFIDKL